MNNLIHIARATAFAGLMTGCIVWSAAAFAADSDAVPTGAIALHGADFTSPRAVAHLKRQVRHVAMDICAPSAVGRTFMSPSEQACYETAVNDGLKQIDGRQQQALRDRSVRLAAASTTGNSSN